MKKEVTYACNKCGWKASIRVEWADLRPKKCLGKRCKTSFLTEPSALLVQMPEDLIEEVTPKVKKKEEANGREEGPLCS